MEEYVKFKLPDIEQVEIKIDCLEEHVPVKGNAICSDDAEFDKKVEDEIIAELEYNQWAWCCIRVTARYKGQEGRDYLGCCSYKDEKDFVETSGYYEQMRQEAYDNLIDNLRGLND